MSDQQEPNATHNGDGSLQKQSDNQFVESAQDVPSSLWPHKMVRHALHLASVATTSLNIPNPPPSSIYSPSGCKYSRLGTNNNHAHASDVDDSFESAEMGNNDENEQDTTAQPGKTSTCTDTTNRRRFPLTNDDENIGPDGLVPNIPTVGEGRKRPS